MSEIVIDNVASPHAGDDPMREFGRKCAPRNGKYAARRLTPPHSCSVGNQCASSAQRSSSGRRRPGRWPDRCKRRRHNSDSPSSRTAHIGQRRRSHHRCNCLQRSRAQCGTHKRRIASTKRRKSRSCLCTRHHRTDLCNTAAGIRHREVRRPELASDCDDGDGASRCL